MSPLWLSSIKFQQGYIPEFMLHIFNIFSSYCTTNLRKIYTCISNTYIAHLTKTFIAHVRSSKLKFMCARLMDGLIDWRNRKHRRQLYRTPCVSFFTDCTFITCIYVIKSGSNWLYCLIMSYLFLLYTTAVCQSSFIGQTFDFLDCNNYIHCRWTYKSLDLLSCFIDRHFRIVPGAAAYRPIGRRYRATGVLLIRQRGTRQASQTRITRKSCDIFCAQMMDLVLALVERTPRSVFPKTCRPIDWQ